MTNKATDVMLYHWKEGAALEKAAARYKIFKSDSLPSASSGWRDSPEAAMAFKDDADAKAKAKAKAEAEKAEAAKAKAEAEKTE